MKIVETCLVSLVALLHVWFMALEMVFWRKPLGLKTFGNTPERAEIMAVLASNQGLYNGFLVVGLLLGLFWPQPAVALAFRVYFLVCVIVAGLYGGWTVNPRIFFVQGLPAAVALACVWAAARAG